MEGFSTFPKKVRRGALVFDVADLVIKRYNKNLFFGIPLSTQIKQGSFFFEFEFNRVLAKLGVETLVSFN